MTRRGLLASAVAIALFVVGDFTGQRWILVTDSMLWATLIVSYAVPWLSVSSIEADHTLEQRGLANAVQSSTGAAPVLAVELRNTKPWRCIGLTATVDLLTDDAQRQSFKFYVPYLASRSTVRLESRLTGARRGRHTTRGVEVSSDAPFGLFRRSRRFAGEASILVLPVPHELDQSGLRETVGRRRERPSPNPREGEVVGSRPYVIGDSARHIHWRNSARSAAIMTKAFTMPTEEGPILTLGADIGSRDLLEDVVRVTAGVGRLHLKAGGRLRLRLGLKEREVSWEGLLRQLAVISNDTLPPLSDSLNGMPPRSTVLAVLPFSDELGVDAVRSAAGPMTDMRVWLLAAEGDIPELNEIKMRTLDDDGATVFAVDTPLAVASQSPAEAASRVAVSV